MQEWTALTDLGEKQFKGGPIGGALLDDNIRRQSIEVGVIEQQEGLRLGKDAETTVRDLRPEPKDIGSGANIEFWYSSMAHRITERFDQGTFFIHGLFFAHDPEPTFPSPSAVLTGPREPLYENPDKPTTDWNREPEGELR